MLARDLVRKYGESLVGRKVYTPPLGDWRGGICVVILIQPDKNAPEIVFQVRHPEHGTIGVFENEDVHLLLLKRVERGTLIKRYNKL